MLVEFPFLCHRCLDIVPFNTIMSKQFITLYHYELDLSMNTSLSSIDVEIHSIKDIWSQWIFIFKTGLPLVIHICHPCISCIQSIHALYIPFHLLHSFLSWYRCSRCWDLEFGIRTRTCYACNGPHQLSSAIVSPLTLMTPSSVMPTPPYLNESMFMSSLVPQVTASVPQSEITLTPVSILVSSCQPEAPPVPGVSIPDVGKDDQSWRPAVRQWEEGDPVQGLLPLKDWPKAWYSGLQRTKAGAKHGQRWLIALEFQWFVPIWVQCGLGD